MSNNRQQLATGLKAILGGANNMGLREGVVTSTPAPLEESTPSAPVTPVAEEAVSEPVLVVAPVAAAAPFEPTSPRVVASQPASSTKTSKPKRKAEPEIALTQPGQRVGTLDRPYVRQRDNQPTRKVGVVLPVELAERLQIHCVKTRARPNAFVEQAILDALERS